jgi:hypothetical protein
MATKYYGSLLIQTPIYNTGQGDFTLVDDAAQKNFPLGGIYIFPDSSQRPRIIKYVEWNPSTAITYYQGEPVYYLDETRTIVSDKVTDAATYVATNPEALFSFAGVILKPTTAPTIGDFIFIQTGGFCDKIRMPASTAAGDILVLINIVTGTAPTNSTFVRIAAGTDFTCLKAAFACVFVTTIAAVGGGLGSGWIKTPLMPI